MPDSLADLIKRRLSNRLGPHGVDPRYHGLYHKSSAAVGKWLVEHGTAKELCEAIAAGEPVLETALSELTDDALDVARWTVRNQLRDLCDEDLLIVLERIAKRAPRHHVVLASGPTWPCPYCKGGHMQWTLDQLRSGIAFLQQASPDENGTPEPPPAQV